jgi:hypothetical protein
MKLYEISGRVTENGYKSEVKGYDVLDYQEGEYVTYQDLLGVSTYSFSCIDHFQRGLLNTDCPSITILTCDEEKVTDYKTRVKREIIRELSIRLDRTKEQLENIK